MHRPDLRRMAQSVRRFLFTDAPPNTSNPLHQYLGVRPRPAVTLGTSAVLIGGGALSAYATIVRDNARAMNLGYVPVPRYSYDGIAGGDPTLGATGELVFGLHNMYKRF